MRRLVLGFLLFVLPAVTTAFGGELIDSVVATVNRSPILLSEWDASVRFECFMQQKPVAQITDADRTAALQRLIDRQLLKLQMHGEKVLRPSSEDLQEQVAKLRSQIPGVSDDAGWRQVLSAYGLSNAELEKQLAQQNEVMNFIEVRLRPAIHVQQEEIQSYYETRLLPDLRANGQAVVKLTDVEPRIRELLTQQHMDEMLDAWLHNLRQQGNVNSTVPLPMSDHAESEAGSEGGQ